MRLIFGSARISCLSFTGFFGSGVTFISKPNKFYYVKNLYLYIARRYQIYLKYYFIHLAAMPARLALVVSHV